MSSVERDVMEYDVVVVGAGPAGLACAIRLKQLKPDTNICVLEKGSSIGAHALSGAVIEPGPLDELAPEWRQSPPGICVPAKRDEFRLLTAKGSLPLPTRPHLHNRGNFIVSLGQLTAWLGQKAEGLGVDVFPGFAAAAPIFDDKGAVAGVQLGDMGVEKNGEPGPNYAPGPLVRARTTVIAEGARGSLAKQLIARFGLAAHSNPQSYGLGMKELWQLPAGRVEPGLIQHTLGWPLDSRTYGGSFIYHLDANRVYVGFVVGLDYEDPRLSPFEAFQQFKHHPSIKPLLEGGEIISAGARTIAAGGWQSIPRLEMPGALLIGDTGGGVNVPKIKGVHQAIRSGMLAAANLAKGSPEGFDALWRASPGGQELKSVRNYKPGFKRGLWFGLANSGLEVVTGGRTPWTLRNTVPDYARLKHLDAEKSPDRHWMDRTLPPRDRLASVFFASTTHDESQPAHLKILDPSLCSDRCAREFGNPCQNFCPANVYEMVDNGQGGKRLQINAANCVHCKACDIKDPYEIINWTVPEGGSGPNYNSL